MAAKYQAILWNGNKKAYDILLVLGAVAFIAVFMVLSFLTWPAPNDISPEILIIRALGSCAFVMLHVVLAIGPLARLSPAFLPLLYNRRHFGVFLFLVALGHAAFATVWYHGFGTVNPLVSVLVSNDQYGLLSPFPFEIFGVIALFILFLMAATSHDFWLANLSARTWKSLHMLVYVAYAALVLHVALGALQSNQSAAYVILLTAGVVALGSLHLLAGMREWGKDEAGLDGTGDWVAAAKISELKNKGARVVQFGDGERVAIWRNGDYVSVTSNVCAHQGGPLGEGRIVDDCITCPWHGYQYDPANGQSPPPFTEKIATYRARIEGDEVWVDPKPLPPGTPVEPARIPAPGAPLVPAAG